MGFGLILLPTQQPWEYHHGTPLHIWMVYCPSVDVHDGLDLYRNRPSQPSVRLLSQLAYPKPQWRLTGRRRRRKPHV